jgi:hypothetical protein
MNEPTGADPYEPPRSVVDDSQPASGGAARAWNPLDAVTFGWETLKRRPWAALTMFLAMLLGSLPGLVTAFVHQWLLDKHDPELVTLAWSIYAAGYLIGTPVSLWMQLGVTKYGIALARGETPERAVAFSGGPLLPAIGVYIVYFVGVGLGMLLCLVPGVILLLGWLPHMQVLVERRTGVVETLSQTWRLTKGHKPALGLLVLLFLCLSIGAFVGGILLICVGLLVTLPAVMLVVNVAQAWTYLKLSGEEPKLPPVGA